MGRWLRALVVLVGVVSSAGLDTPMVDARTARGFEVVAWRDLGAQGMHAGLAVAGECAYVGARNDRGVLVLDIDGAAAPRVVGELPARPGSTPRELRAAADLLVVLNYRLDALSTAPNTLDLYDVRECAAPVLVGRVDFGEARPHEFVLWRDPSPARAGRVLAFVAMWGYPPNLRVVDVSDPANPAVVATWDAGEALGLPSRLHSLTVTPDGSRAYLADWDAGLIVLDTSALAAGRPDPEPVPLTPLAAALRLPGGNLHSAVPVPGRDLVVTTQEIYGPGACPYGRLHVVDVADSAAPVVVGAYGAPENDPAACGATAGLDGAFTTHNPLVIADVAFVSWYAGGLRAVNLRDPAAPVEAGVFVPEPLPAVAADDPTLGSYPVRVWSSPIIRDGLVYVVDIRNGLFVLRYTGPRSAAIAAVALAEANAT